MVYPRDARGDVSLRAFGERAADPLGQPDPAVAVPVFGQPAEVLAGPAWQQQEPTP